MCQQQTSSHGWVRSLSFSEVEKPNTLDLRNFPSVTKIYQVQSVKMEDSKYFEYSSKILRTFNFPQNFQVFLSIFEYNSKQKIFYFANSNFFRNFEEKFGTPLFLNKILMNFWCPEYFQRVLELLHFPRLNSIDLYFQPTDLDSSSSFPRNWSISKLLNTRYLKCSSTRFSSRLLPQRILTYYVGQCSLATPLGDLAHG